MEEVFYRLHGLLLIGVILGFTFIYEAYRIQKQQGVVTQSRLVYVTMLIVTLLQIFIGERFDIDIILWYGLIFVIIIASLLYTFYISGKKITIYETTHERIKSKLERELNEMNIAFEIKNGFHSEETVYHLIEDDTKISIDGNFLGDDERKNFSLSFKKSWRSYRMEELQLRLLEAYRKEKEGHIFWKQITLNCVLGVLLMTGIGYFWWDMYRKIML